MEKIMILGSAGMLGHMVYHCLASTKKYEIADTSFPVKANEKSTILDVTDKKSVEEYIHREKPAVVINCIGILIKESIVDPSNAIYLNSYFPHQLSKILRKEVGRLIHISTDCVFSGVKGNYSENDFRDADNVYGRSKALGEVINEYDLTIRTSIIGPELKENGEGLFHWFMKQKSEIKGYSKVYWGGVTTLELAKVIESAIEQDIKGLIHITNGIKISKYELLNLLKQMWNRDNISIIPFDGKTEDKSLTSTRTDFQYIFPSYEEMLKNLYSWMQIHSDLYGGKY
jgi:dTDP-4-dehydrorhamnose reductase